MAQRFWSGQIGDLVLEEETENPCGFELIGAGAFLRGGWTGNTRRGLLGNPHTQFSELSDGREIELRFLHIPATLFDSLIDLLVALNPDGETLACTFQDGF